MYGKCAKNGIKLGASPNGILMQPRETRNLSGDEIANVNFFYDDIFNHFYAVRPGSYRIR